VNNKITIGNNRGTATLTMSGGSLTKTAGDDTSVGRDNGTGTLTQSGGTIALNHNFYVGQGGGGNGTLNLSGSAVLNTGRDFVIGREGGTGALNMSGGTITKTGDEKFLVGHNNGTGTVVQSGGTITANNELYIGNENAGASGTYTLSGTGALTISNEVVVGRESGTGILNVDGGTITTTGNGNMYIGRRNGTGTLTQTDGTISVNREFGVGTRDDNKIGTGTYNLSGGSLSVSNNIFIGKELGSSGTVNMTGGTMTTSDKLQIGHNQSTGAVTQSGGTVNVQNEVYVGNETTNTSVGTYTLSGTGILNVGNEIIVGRDNGTGTFNLDGGTVNAAKISGGTGSATVNFNGGVLKAKRDEANVIENLDTANVESGGIKIDSNGFNVATSQALSGTGGLEKSGAGSLTLNGAHTYTGPTLVSAGTLKLELNSSITSAVTVNTDAALAGAGTVAGNLAFNSNAKFVFSLTETLLVNGAGVSFADFGIDDLVGLSSATDVGAYTIIGGSADIDTTGLLNLGAANAFDLGGGKSAYFTEGSLVVNVVPEPSTYALLALAGLGLAGHVVIRRRR
jgi:autotransporter-associated beta strand protein/T5SS/PEP-CTERM-associated repeat protein